jgi:polyhydroxyalkanoate synthesis repressor PhaR
MSDSRVQIKRYPNRRYYARHLSKYVSLQEIEEMIQQGETVEIRDSQTGEDLTRTVLTQIIAERHPEKMELFPTDMLHFILRSNDAMSGFLRDYFRHSLTYLEYLHRHNPSSATLSKPIHWLQTWLDTIAPMSGDDHPAPSSSDEQSLRDLLLQMDQRLRRLEERD